MTLGERLRTYLGDGVGQKAIAIEWNERLAAAGSKKLAESSAASRLSQLFADEPQGVRTFFKDPRRAELLFDVLGVAAEARAELRALAEPALAGDPAPRLVVDLSDLPTDALSHDVFEGLRGALLGDDALLPLALVLTEAQYARLPRTFDHARVTVEQVRDPAAGAAAVARLVSDGAPLLGYRPLVVAERWWALAVERGRVVLEPVDGLGRLRATGRLAAPEVEHPLTAVTDDAPDNVAVPAGGPGRRRLIHALADETSPESLKPAGWRLGAAAALGVEATSTARERVEHAVAAIGARLGVPVAKRTPEQWAALVARAARRPAALTVARVGDVVHVLNPTAPLEPAPHLVVETVACAEPSLTVLERALAAMTEDDLVDDPLLSRLVYRLAGDDADALRRLFHARAVLVYGGRVAPKAAAAVPKPLAALAELVANDVPEALIRVRADAGTVTFGAPHRSVTLPRFGYPSGRIYATAMKESALLQAVPPTADVLWSRAEPLKGARPVTGYEAGYPSPSAHHAAVVDPGATVEQWLDDVEASILFGGSGARPGARICLPEPEAGKGYEWTSVPTPSRFWSDADTLLALAWWALREALTRPRSIRLPNGAVLLAVGGGLAARVHVRRYGKKAAPVRGAVRCALRFDGSHGGRGFHLGELGEAVTTHVADTDGYTSRIGVLMPSLWLAGKGFAADVEFVPAPMLPPAASVPDGAVAGIVGAVAAIDAAEQRAQDDDD